MQSGAKMFFIRFVWLRRRLKKRKQRIAQNGSSTLDLRPFRTAELFLGLVFKADSLTHSNLINLNSLHFSRFKFHQITRTSHLFQYDLFPRIELPKIQREKTQVTGQTIATDSVNVAQNVYISFVFTLGGRIFNGVKVSKVKTFEKKLMLYTI